MIKILPLLLSLLMMVAHAAEVTEPAVENSDAETMTPSSTPSLRANDSFDLRLDFSASDTEAVATISGNTENGKPEPKDNHQIIPALNSDVPEKFTEIIGRINCCALPENLEFSYGYGGDIDYLKSTEIYNSGGSHPVDYLLKDVFDGFSAEEVVAIIDWLQQASDQGGRNEQFFLGWIYENGVDVIGSNIIISGWPSYGDLISTDETKAAYWYRKLAEQGYPEAQYRLGKLSENVIRAYWYYRAAQQGHYLAMKAIGVSYEEGTGVPAAFAKAINWYRKVAKLGDTDMAYELGMMYANGKYVPEDDVEAIHWFQKATLGCHQTLPYFQLGLMYANGEGVSVDKSEAARFYQHAASRGDYEAQYQLGLAYYKGDGVTKNYIDAYVWLYLSGRGESGAITEVAAKLTKAELQKAEKLAERNYEQQRIGHLSFIRSGC